MREKRSAPAVSLAVLADEVRACRRCRRLSGHHARLAKADPEAYCKPVPGWGNPAARVWIVGLAPGAKGAGYTGVPFTRDRSGLFLRAALRRVGLDDSEAGDVFISNAARCVPPGNRPTTEELRRCERFLRAEWELLPAVRAVLCLGGVAWKAVTAVASVGRVPAFAHGAELRAGARVMLASFHVSPLNVNTGRLTESMFDTVLKKARTIAAG